MFAHCKNDLHGIPGRAGKRYWRAHAGELRKAVAWEADLERARGVRGAVRERQAAPGHLTQQDDGHGCACHLQSFLLYNFTLMLHMQQWLVEYNCGCFARSTKAAIMNLLVALYQHGSAQFSAQQHLHTSRAAVTCAAV